MAIVRSSDAWWRVHLSHSAVERPPWPTAERFDSIVGLVSELTASTHEVTDFLT